MNESKENVQMKSNFSEMAIFTAYVLLNDKFHQKSNQGSINSKVNEFLSKKYKIIESTIQIASKDEFLACNIDKFNKFYFIILIY